MKLKTLDDLLLHELQDLYSAEAQILEALPKMIENANNDDLRMGLEQHLEETQQQVARLDEVADMMGESLAGENCKGMEGLLIEGEKVLKMDGDADVKDAAIIAAAQRVEHYEMAGYGCAVAFAKQLGKDDIADILQETLDEEGAANKKLSAVAEGGLFKTGVNDKADKMN